MKELIYNLLMVIGGCYMVYAVGNYMIPYYSELGAFFASAISIGFVIVGGAGIIRQIYRKIFK